MLKIVAEMYYLFEDNGRKSIGQKRQTLWYIKNSYRGHESNAA